MISNFFSILTSKSQFTETMVHYRSVEEVVLAALRQNGDALQHASPELQLDLDVRAAALLL